MKLLPLSQSFRFIINVWSYKTKHIQRKMKFLTIQSKERKNTWKTTVSYKGYSLASAREHVDRAHQQQPLHCSTNCPSTIITTTFSIDS